MVKPAALNITNTILGRALRRSSSAVFFLLLCAAFAPLNSALATEIKALRVWDSPEHTRAVFDLSNTAEYKVFELDNPGRVVLDIQGGKLANGFSTPNGQGVIGSVRTGRPTPQQLRVVFDLASGARPKSFLLAPAGGKGHRLVVDLYRSGSSSASPVKTVASVTHMANREVVVAIDAGHGGEDPGAIGPTGAREKEVVLATAKLLANAIDAEPGMKAVLIRSGDYFVPLKRRYAKAREQRADLFISIHADAFTRRSASGMSVYMLSQRGASSESARFLAASENASDSIGGVPLDDKDSMLTAVLLDLSQGATLQASDAVANRMVRSMSQLGKMHKHDVQRANFVVLRSPDVPSILIETAFISNPEEERRLKDPKHRARLANAMLEGVRDYFHANAPQGTWIAANRKPTQEHIVSPGETLSHIAKQHGISINKLRAVNAISGDSLRVGKVLKIPANS